MIGFLRSTSGREDTRSFALIAVVFLIGVFLPSALPSRAAAASIAMRTGRRIAPPIGAMLFCAQHGPECGSDDAADSAPPLPLTPALLATLLTVQQTVNRAIEPSPRPDLAWHYATNDVGNCVQYAMEKRRALIASGLPAANLELATARTPNAESHLVLVVRTVAGDLVLDNLQDEIVPWQQLPYRWIARQEGPSLACWVRIIG